MTDFKAQGKANRAKGARFELKIRKFFEDMGWIVCKWQNNIDLEEQKIIQAKANPFNKFNRSGNGFPDFLVFQPTTQRGYRKYILKFVECKSNGTLSKLEKQKMEFLRSDGHECWVAYDEEGKIGFRKFGNYKK